MRKLFKSSAEILTRIAGFTVKSANNYTMELAVLIVPSAMVANTVPSVSVIVYDIYCSVFRYLAFRNMLIFMRHSN